MFSREARPSAGATTERDFPRTAGEWRGVTVEYSHIADRLYFGFEAREGFNLAMPEKALLDCIYYRNSAPFQDELELEGLDTERLQYLLLWRGARKNQQPQHGK